MLLIKTIPELRSQLKAYHQNPKFTVGLVPTMGALHQGHLSLIEQAIADNNCVVVSIFVNPLQFAPNEDLAQYPRTLERDCQRCQELGVDLVFAPDPVVMNSQGDTSALTQTTTVIPPPTMTEVLCGQYRVGHFVGVATIVTKLLNIVQPDRAYFGQKDAQQLAIIRRLVTDLNLNVNIVPCPIAREASGLALSSRNQYLTESQKAQAAQIYRSLQAAKTAFDRGETDGKNLINLVQEQLEQTKPVTIQYVELVDPDSLQPLTEVRSSGLLAIAAYVGSTRLIDNMVLQKSLPIIAIDGPAGAGKSTITRRLAHQLGLLYLDTGAMYRAVTWLVMEAGITIDDETGVAQLIADLNLNLTSPKALELPTIVHVNGQEVTQEIRTPEVTANVSAIAAQSAVREKLVKMQQKLGVSGGIIAEGRDIGTNVFPNAELKIFLTASAQERAKRRLSDFKKQGREDIDLAQLTADIQRRDEQDSNRAIAPLKQAADAIEIVTDNLTVEEAIAKVIELYRAISQNQQH